MKRVSLIKELFELQTGLESSAIESWLNGLLEDLDAKALAREASLQIANDPAFSQIASYLLCQHIEAACRDQDIHSFSQSISKGHELGLISPNTRLFVMKHQRALDDSIDKSRNRLLEYFGLTTLADRYLLLNPEGRRPIETPQYFFMRVACGLSENIDECLDFYQWISSLSYLPSTPTLFNAGTCVPQMSSCFLLDSPQDTLESIYDTYKNIALLSKHSGGVGVAFHRIRSRGSLIRGTNGFSNGIVPWLKTLDSSVAAVNQGGKRKGACCVYLETWHADLEEFLEMRDNTGDTARRTHNINLAHWIPDLFMKRVERDEVWSLFDPKDTPDLCDLFGQDFEKAYLNYEKEGLMRKQLPARELYGRMMRTLAQTGNGWINFKDASNLKCSQTKNAGRVVHLSNLCTEILEVTDAKHTAVCNLGSINLSKFVNERGDFDYARLRNCVRGVFPLLDRVIDKNFYPIEEAQRSNSLWRPVGLGIMGLQDVFFQLKLPFDSSQAKQLSTSISEHVYFYALEASNELAQKHGRFPYYPESRYAENQLQFDLWKTSPASALPWDELRSKIRQNGLRNSLVIAIAPTATIASIAGCCESIEPQISNMFKRETLSGEFVQSNKYLVRELKSLGLWTPQVRDALKRANGSVLGLTQLPKETRMLFRTAWEISMRSLIDLASSRGPFVDQSQSLNLFMETPTIEKMSAMYFYAWKSGLKTTYYLRSRPASEISLVSAGPSEECEVCQ